MYFMYKDKSYMDMKTLRIDNKKIEETSPIVIVNNTYVELSYLNKVTEELKTIEFLIAEDGDLHIGSFNSKGENITELNFSKKENKNIYSLFKNFIIESRMRLEANNIGIFVCKVDKGYECIDYYGDKYKCSNQDELLAKINLEKAKRTNMNFMGKTMELQQKGMNSIVITCDDTRENETPIYTFKYDENNIVTECKLQSNHSGSRIRAHAGGGRNKTVGLFEGHKFVDGMNKYAEKILKIKELRQTSIRDMDL